MTAVADATAASELAPSIAAGFTSFESRWSVPQLSRDSSEADSVTSPSPDHESDAEDENELLPPLTPQGTTYDGLLDVDEGLAPRPKSSSAIHSKAPSKWPRSDPWRRFRAKLRITKQTDVIHQMWSSIHKRLYHAPLNDSSLKNALDIGTGQGLWAVEFASKHRDCQVTAVDFQAFDNWEALNPLGPDGQRPLPNLRFSSLPADRGLRWEFAETFDYIHARHLTFSVDHASFFQSTFNNLNPGGWAEFNEWVIELRSSNGFSPGRGDAVRRWNDAVVEGARQFGQNPKAALKFKPMLEDIGFVDVVQLNFQVPLSQWVPDPELRKLGALTYNVLLMAIGPVSARCLGGGLNWSPAKIDAIISDVLKDLANPDFHCFLSVMMTFCQKPESVAGSTSEVTITAGHDTSNKEFAYMYNRAAHLPIWCASEQG